MEKGSRPRISPHEQTGFVQPIFQDPEHIRHGRRGLRPSQLERPVPHRQLAFDGLESVLDRIELRSPVEDGWEIKEKRV